MNNDEIQETALKLQEKEFEVLKLEDEVNTILKGMKVYEQYVKAQKELDDFRKEFNFAAMKYLKNNNLKTSEGPAGKITLVSRNTYSVSDANLLEGKYKEIPKLENKLKELKSEVKKEFELFNEEVPGFEKRVSEYVLITPKKIGSS